MGFYAYGKRIDYRKTGKPNKTSVSKAAIKRYLLDNGYGSRRDRAIRRVSIWWSSLVVYLTSLIKKLRK